MLEIGLWKQLRIPVKDIMFNQKSNKMEKSNQFGEVGKRTLTQIQKEVEHLKEQDKQLSNRVRATYSITTKKS